MYCRECHYDLRGQDVPRCPECGTAFAFDDPSSYLRRVPGFLGRRVQGIRRRRWFLLVVLTAALLCGYAEAYSHMPSLRNARHERLLSAQTLKWIMAVWMNYQREHPRQHEFDADVIGRAVGTRPSPWSEPTEARRRATLAYVLEFGGVFVIPILAYLIAVGVLFRWRMRRIGFAALLVAALVILGCRYANETAVWLYPGTHAYLKDYVFISGVNLARSNPQRGMTIAAYDIHIPRKHARLTIAYGDGHVNHLWWDDRAKPLFEAQGIPFPEGLE